MKKDFNISQDAVGDASPSNPLNPPKCFLFDKYLAGSGFYPQMPQNLICLLSFRGGLKVGVFLRIYACAVMFIAQDAGSRYCKCSGIRPG